LISLNNIVKKCSEDTVINNLSFDFGKKGIYTLLDLDGETKKAIFNIVAGIDFDYSGDITVKQDTYNAKESEKKLLELKRRVGYVPSELKYPADMTAYELLSFVADTKRVSADLKYRQIKEAFSLTGTDNVKNVLFSNLSFDTARKIAIAAALLGNPDALLLDGILDTSDGKVSEEIKDIILTVSKVKTVILGTKNVKVAETLGGNIAILSRGKLVISDTLAGIYDTINKTRTMLVRAISKEGKKSNEAISMLSGIESVIECNVRSVSGQGEFSLKIELLPSIDAERDIVKCLTSNGYIILSSEIVELTLSDVCSVLFATKDGGNK